MRIIGAVGALLLILTGWASAQPDPRLMAGQALPAPELPDGTITVRVGRDTIGNDIVGQLVELTVDGTIFSGDTDEEGRAEFPNLPAGATAVALTVVDGERLESTRLSVPATGGLRVMLISGLSSGAGSALADEPPPVPGTVVVGANSRILTQFQNDTMQVFYLLSIVNAESQRVDIGGPLILDLPQGASQAAILEGATGAATVIGDRVTLLGPFAPGTTSLQVGFTLPHSSRELEVEQAWPIAVEGLAVGVEQVGDLRVTSAAFVETSQIRADDGTPYLLGEVASLEPGTVLSVTLSNLPLHSQVPRNVALVLAGCVLLGGAWLAFRRPTDPVSSTGLVQRRDALLASLVAIDARRRAAGMEGSDDATQRDRIMSELEEIYAQLDPTGRARGGGKGKGVAA